MIIPKNPIFFIPIQPPWNHETMENPPSNPHLQVMGQEKNAALHGWAERALAAGGEKDWRSIFGGPEGVD